MTVRIVLYYTLICWTIARIMSAGLFIGKYGKTETKTTVFTKGQVISDVVVSLFFAWIYWHLAGELK